MISKYVYQRIGKGKGALGWIALALGIFLAVSLRGGKAQIIKTAQAVVGELIIDQSVSGSSTLGIITAQKLMDGANSAYFLDPAATGDSLVAAGKVTAESFSGDGSLLTGISGIPAGLVSFFNLASCPTGWTELTAARGRVVVGLPASGTLAGTIGTTLTNLEDRTHTHTYTDVIAHTHSVSMSQGETGGSNVRAYDNNGPALKTFYTNSTGISTGTTAATSNVIPYIQLLACQKN